MVQSTQILRVTEIGEYIRHRSCERRFKLEINNRAEARKLPFAERLFNALDPVLQETGKRREEEWELALQKNGLVDLTAMTNFQTVLSPRHGLIFQPECRISHPAKPRMGEK
ncbi:MAG: hypothetical protein WDN23_04195 [Edaphobacter sp.]